VLQSTGCQRLDADLAAFAALVEHQPAGAQDLAGALRRASDVVAKADFGAYDTEAVRANGRQALDNMLDLRVVLRERVPAWHVAGYMSRDAQSALRGAFRDGRYATDMLGELIHGFPEPPKTKDRSPVRAFTGGALSTLVNPRYGADGSVTFQSGDLLLVRGTLANSAAIARIGDIDSQFSHIGLIHVDDRGRVSLVEALIEAGAVVTPIETALTHDLARAVLFRPRDRQLGARAAAMVKAHVDKSNSGSLPHIPYDFSMRPEGYRELFCSKLIRFAYAAASDGELTLPTYNTRLDMANRRFFRQIGVETIDTFAPADVELEPLFDIVAEWRDYSKTPLVRNQDAVMDMIFWWMETRGDVFRESLSIEVLSLFGKLSSYLPRALKRVMAPVVPEVPANMSRSAIAAIAMLHATAKPLTKAVMALERETVEAQGRPLHPREAYALLDTLREKHGRRIKYLTAPLPS